MNKLNKEPEGLSVFFPCYNEAGNIGAVLKSAWEFFSQRFPVFELIVVDDGSTDNTASVVEELSLHFSQIRLVRHSQNCGYGSALVTGLCSAKYSYIFFTDGDGQFGFTDFPRFWDTLIKEKDSVVIGYRFKRVENWVRRFNATAWRLLIGIFLGLWVRDVDCAYKLLRCSDLAGVELHSRGALISAELLIKLKQRGKNIRELPVAHFPRSSGKATGADIRVILRAFREFILYGKELRIRKKENFS